MCSAKGYTRRGNKEMLIWFKCDKGWIGVKQEQRRRILEILNSISYESKVERIEDIPDPSLDRVKAFADNWWIPYEIKEDCRGMK